MDGSTQDIPNGESIIIGGIRYCENKTPEQRHGYLPPISSFAKLYNPCTLS